MSERQHAFGFPDHPRHYQRRNRLGRRLQVFRERCRHKGEYGVWWWFGWEDCRGDGVKVYRAKVHRNSNDAQDELNAYALKHDLLEIPVL